MAKHSMISTNKKAEAIPLKTHLTSKNWEGETFGNSTMGRADRHKVKVCSEVNQVSLFRCSEHDLFHSKIFIYPYGGQKTVGERETLLTANLTPIQKLNL